MLRAETTKKASIRRRAGRLQLRGEQRWFFVAGGIARLKPRLRGRVVPANPASYGRVAVGSKVVGLHRLQIGEICLDDSLAEGEWRHLTEEEIASV